jgi:hypothetical protein
VARTRVFKLAKQLGATTRQIQDLARELGFTAPSPQSMLSPAEVEAVTKRWSATAPSGDPER